MKKSGFIGEQLSLDFSRYCSVATKVSVKCAARTEVIAIAAFEGARNASGDRFFLIQQTQVSGRWIGREILSAAPEGKSGNVRFQVGGLCVLAPKKSWYRRR